MSILIFRWLLTFMLAVILGKIAAQLKLPAVLGWLLAGLLLGPYGFNVSTLELISAPWYHNSLIFIEFIVGTIVGGGILLKEMRQAGKAIIGITIGESLGTFIVVLLTFGLIFWFQDIPFFMALIFGAIALATAPVPALSIVKEYDAQGPVAKTLAILAALDDVVATAVFFTLMAILSGTVLSSNMPLYMIPFLLLAPIGLGAFAGVAASWVINDSDGPLKNLVVFVTAILVTPLVGIYLNTLMAYGTINYLLMGMAFSATVVNLVPLEKRYHLFKYFNPISGVCFILFIMNLGFPLDYQLILGAGFYSAMYMVSRAVGKYFGTYLSAKAYQSPATVTKYLGLTLLPHSGVSLAFTSVAAAALMPVFPDFANLIIGTISSAAIINEVIAVLIAKKAFILAGEIK